MKIGVIGGGVTGSATAAAFRGHCDEVRVYDVDYKRRTHLLPPVLACDVVFVCLPEDSVEDFFRAMAHSDVTGKVVLGNPVTCCDRNYVLRSTVPVGTTRRLAERYGLVNLVHSPEFLTERTAVEDAANPRLNIVGLVDKDAPWLVNLYRRRWPQDDDGNYVPVRAMSCEQSELVKLATNAFFATKVSFWNEIESYCRAVGIDYETVRAACVAEGRVGDLHTRVPGPDGLRGFGGKCLPKDLAQLIRCFNETGTAAPVILQAVKVRNECNDRMRKE